MTIDVDDWGIALTTKERVFVAEYLIDLNAAQAAVRAGYCKSSAARIGAKYLRKPEIAQAIAAAIAARASRTGVTADRVVTELARIGFADIRKIVHWRTSKVSEEEKPDGDHVLVVKTIVTNTVELIGGGDIDDDTAAAIAEISQGTNGSVKVKMHDKRAALVELGRHLGMFKDKAETKDAPAVKAEVSATEILRDRLERLAGRSAQPPVENPPREPLAASSPLGEKRRT